MLTVELGLTPAHALLAAFEIAQAEGDHREDGTNREGGHELGCGVVLSPSIFDPNLVVRQGSCVPSARSAVGVRGTPATARLPVWTIAGSAARSR
jgi:hypothetical protein